MTAAAVPTRIARLFSDTNPCARSMKLAEESEDAILSSNGELCGKLETALMCVPVSARRNFVFDTVGIHLPATHDLVFRLNFELSSQL